MSVHRGQCHCGAVGFEFRTSVAPADWSVRACQCSFCLKHGVVSTSDPAGSVRFTHENPSLLSRYRFGHKTADFVFCGRCGGYLGAVTEECGQTLMVINLRALDP
ncbi:MAG: GFA family protein [Steroidobacteraceae bacterium]